MKKRAVSMLLTAVMAVTGMAATATVAHAEGEEGKVINIYSWNDEFRTRLEAIYPEVESTSRNPVTNLKYHFVVTAAMLTRYCIDGGMEAEQAYRLSDFYILKMDSCTSLRQIADLHHTMAKDFTGKMILQKKLSVLSKPVMQCIDYIYAHIKDRITIEDLACHTGLSQNYLSRVFKQNLGISISDYIREKKIEKATHLLRYSDKAVVDIANYLSFSSQSHFIQVFENFTGLTPKKYRDRYYKSMW